MKKRLIGSGAEDIDVLTVVRVVLAGKYGGAWNTITYTVSGKIL